MDSVTIYVDTTMTNITCAPTSGTQCFDLMRTATITGGQNYSIRIATHGGDTLANVLVTIQLQ